MLALFHWPVDDETHQVLTYRGLALVAALAKVVDETLLIAWVIGRGDQMGEDEPFDAGPSRHRAGGNHDVTGLVEVIAGAKAVVRHAS